MSQLLIKQNPYLFVLYFDVHLSKFNPFPLLAYAITPSLQQASDLTDNS